MKAKSEVSFEDVNAIVEIGLELFSVSQNKLYAQVAHCLSKLFFWYLLSFFCCCLIDGSICVN